MIFVISFYDEKHLTIRSLMLFLSTRINTCFIALHHNNFAHATNVPLLLSSSPLKVRHNHSPMQQGNLSISFNKSSLTNSEPRRYVTNTLVKVVGLSYVQPFTQSIRVLIEQQYQEHRILTGQVADIALLLTLMSRETK